MKFTKALLILVATVTLTLGNGLDVSDYEDNGVSGADLDAGFGNSSDIEPEADHNVAPVETPIVPPSLPSMNNNYPPADSGNMPPATDSSNMPPATDSGIVPPTDSSFGSNPPTSTDSGYNPVDSTNSNPVEVPADGISGQNVDMPEIPDIPNSSDVEPDNMPVDGTNINTGDVNSANNTPVTDGNGENSDDSGDTQPIDNIDGADTLDQIDSTNTIGQNTDNVDSANANDLPPEGSDEEKEDDGISTGGKVAGGLAGVAAVSSAGLFYYLKRAKHAGLESVRTQITMV